MKHYTIIGVARAELGQCPQCLSKRVLGPRVIKDDGVKWCHCYKCKHVWKLGAVGRKQGHKPKRAYKRKNDKLRWEE